MKSNQIKSRIYEYVLFPSTCATLLEYFTISETPEPKTTSHLSLRHCRKSTNCHVGKKSVFHHEQRAVEPILQEKEP
jgi:hypothetical protein